MDLLYKVILYLDKIYQRRATMSAKVDFTCLICSKIYKSPFSLPCGDTICEEHLKEPEVLKHNSFKCQSCGEVFEVKNNQMIRSNKALLMLIQNERFLSDEEKLKKKCLERSIQNFSQLNEQLQTSKNMIDLECHNHFQEMRRKIDVQREELKDQIDKISLAMIDQIILIEMSYSIPRFLMVDTGIDEFLKFAERPSVEWNNF